MFDRLNRFARPAFAAVALSLVAVSVPAIAEQKHDKFIFEQLGDEGTLKYEIMHRDCIARFGRYPRRNEALGRPSTPEEIEYINSGDGMF